MLTVKQVAERLSVSPSKVYRLIETGQLAHHRIGGSIRMTEEQVATFLEATRREPGIKLRQPVRRPSLKHIRL